MSDPISTPKKLLDIRKQKNLKLKKTKHLKETFIDLSGQERPLVLRYYQVQAVAHLVAMRRFLLGDDTGLGKCCSLNTWIPTDQGLIQMRDLAPKDTLLEPDTFYPLEKPYQIWTGWEWAPIKRYYYNGVKPTRTIQTKKGYTLTGSLVHPIWVHQKDGEERFVQLANVDSTDYICIDRAVGGFSVEEPKFPFFETQSWPKNQTCPVPDHLSPKFAALLAYIITKGWNPDSVSGFYTCDLDNARYRKSLLYEFFGGGTKPKLKISSPFLRVYLAELGLKQCTAEMKRVPWPIFQGTRESISSFLQVLFDNICVVASGAIKITRISEMLAKEIQMLLLRFGIICLRQIKHGSFGHTYWQIIIRGNDNFQLFQDLIGFLSVQQQKRLAKLCRTKSTLYSDADFVPDVQSEVAAIRLEIIARAEIWGYRITDRWGADFYETFKSVRKNNYKPTYSFLRKTLRVAKELGVSLKAPAYKAIENLVNRHFYYDSIVNITDGEEEVADLEIDHPRHCFAAEGFINHNTLESIAALCCLWETDPNRKVIILTTKSAARQWANEFEKFTTGIQVFVCKGTPKQRDQIRKQYLNATGPTVLISGYRSMVQDFTHIQEWKDYVYITDECFQYHTSILLADGSTELIGKIVSQKLPVEVLSWNFETNKYEVKKVVAWHRNPVQKEMFQLCFRFGGEVQVTLSHKFFSPSGKEVEAKDLQIGSEILHFSATSQELVTDWITDKIPWVPPLNDKYVYNLEVEDNHNYFANGSLVSNCTAYKNPATQVHQVCRHMSEQADRVWALSATLIKNNLMEGFGIYQVVNSHIFMMGDQGHEHPMSKNQFMLYFCLTRQQPIGNGRFVTVIVGYAPDKIREFKDIIDPWYIGRPKHEVASELPTLTSKLLEVDLTPEQEEKYQQALDEFLEMGIGDKAQVKDVTKLTAIIYCQEIINHLELIDCEGGTSPKLDALVELLTEGDFETEKVIVFSRFSKMVDIIMKRLAKEKIKAVRVTGKESGDERDVAMKAFQDPANDTRVICITTAGSESINLQTAKALVCFDTPWSAGDYLQLIGRMIRIGSVHDKCYVIHLIGVATGMKVKKTIDHRVMEVLAKKMHLIEAVLGKRIKGDSDSDAIIPVENEISDLFVALRHDAEKGPKE